MKKFLTALLCICTAAAFSVGFTACSDTDKDAVNLVAIDGTQVGVRSDIDYYVVPEPAASTRVNAIAELNFVGDLQQLYGGENGYPQAVVVAKTELVTESDFAGRFISELNKCSDWLLNDNTSAETVVNAVQSHLTDGLSPTFTANNLTKDVIKNCGINFVSAENSKQSIIDFMQKINAVSETSFGTPSDAFFWGGISPDAEYSGTVSVYAPDGAPALGIANLLSAEQSFYNGVAINYEIVDANLITSYVTGDLKADICVLPVNVAVKLLGSGEKYKLLGTLTHGNLFMVSKDGTQITSNNLTSLTGKTVGVVNLAAVPGLTFKIILKNYGIEYTELV